MNNDPMEIIGSQLLEIVSGETPEVKNVICLVDPVCWKCGGSSQYEINRNSIEAQDSHWDLRGEGRFKRTTVTCRCPACASMFQALAYMIPIECAPFPCPQCGQIQQLEYKIQRIQVEYDAFQFEATLTCKKCGNAKSFKEVLTRIVGVLKITVGPTGITVSKN